METLSNLVSSLAIIIILGSLLEMFLPSGELKKYVQVIIGLFILVTILNPCLALINKEWTNDLQAWTIQDTDVSLTEILADGEQIRVKNQNQAVKQYEQKLAAQISSMVNLVGGIQVKDAKVEVKGKEGVLGEIDKIKLTVSNVNTTVSTENKLPLVQPVVIDVSGQPEEKRTKIENTPIPAPTLKHLKTTLANLYGIPPEAIEISSTPE